MTSQAATLLQARGLHKRYTQPSWFWRGQPAVEALRGVDLEIEAGATLAVVGESGSGKSTLARCLARLEQPDSGEIWFEQQEIARLRQSELHPFRSRLQLVFQHAAGALNPRFTAAQVIEEPLLLQGRGAAASRQALVAGALEAVGLERGWGSRPVLAFSGGQRQRLAIARALVLEPQLLILDEPFTGLDLSIQAQILELLRVLQGQHRLTYLLISHDLEVVARIADEVAVMCGGQIVERAPTARLLRSPQNEYTQALVRAQELLRGAASA